MVTPDLKAIYGEVYNTFPSSDAPEHRYNRREWIFPHHINIMIAISEELCTKYGGDHTICYLGCLLHDVGLVVGRKGPSAAGHEARSERYAKELLEKHGCKKELIQEVLACIRATQAGQEAAGMNERIVRTADALAKLRSPHYLAKAAFSEDIASYMDWLEKKLDADERKLMFAEERESAQGAIQYLRDAIVSYRSRYLD